MNRSLHFLIVLIFSALLGIGNIQSLWAQNASAGFTLEIQVVPKVSLRIESEGQSSLAGGILPLNFGNVDAFGISRSPGVYVESTPQGAAYYRVIRITAGSTGGISQGSSLQVGFLGGSSLPSDQFFEQEGERINPGQPLKSLRPGAPSPVLTQIQGIQQVSRIIGVVIKPENPPGPFSAQIQYSLQGGL